MTTRPHVTLEIPVRTVGVEVVHGRVTTTPDGPREKLTIGSAEGADLVVEDPSVSRFHVELSASGSGIRVVDLGSTNGVVSGTTYLDDAVVPPGTLIELGGACIRLTRGTVSSTAAHRVERLEALVCSSAVMRRLAHRLTSLATSDLPVLIEGPPGSGKELVAATLHHLSRPGTPFVVVDCGTLTDALGQSELFGHEKGAFTDASQVRKGALERASGGVLVLDEIGALSPSLQPALLGVLERRRFRRMGGSDELTLGARIFTTSTADLRRQVNTGRFRLDLHYRIAGVRVSVPPLAERLDDLPALVGDFLHELGHGASHELASPASLEALAARSWPQNVRELRAHLTERVILGEASAGPPPELDDSLTMNDLFAELGELPYRAARARFETHFEAAYLRRLADAAGGSVSAAARLAELDRAQLRTIAKRAGVLLKK
jgi:DNA-binding NtrC family response regulator